MGAKQVAKTRQGTLFSLLRTSQSYLLEHFQIKLVWWKIIEFIFCTCRISTSRTIQPTVESEGEYPGRSDKLLLLCAFRGF